jgi:hypothetical protein
MNKNVFKTHPLNKHNINDNDVTITNNRAWLLFTAGARIMRRRIQYYIHTYVHKIIKYIIPFYLPDVKLEFVETLNLTLIH